MASARFRTEIDWGGDGYQHARADVSSLVQSYVYESGNRVYDDGQESRVNLGIGRLQLLVQGDDLDGAIVRVNRLYAFRVTETVSGHLQADGWAVVREALDAEFAGGEVLVVDLLGKGVLKEGGTITYPAGSEFGGTPDQAVQIIVSEEVIDPTDFAVATPLSGTLPTRTTTMSDGVAIGVASGDALITIASGQRRTGDTFGADATRNEPGTLQQQQYQFVGPDYIAFLPATVGIETETITWNDTVFEVDGVVWRVRHSTGRSYSRVAAGSYTVTNTNGVSVLVTIAAPIEYNEQTWNRWEYVGRRRRARADGALSLDSADVIGGTVPEQVRGSEAHIAAPGVVYAVVPEAGTFIGVTPQRLICIGGIGGSPTVEDLGRVPGALYNSPGGVHVGGRLYLLTGSVSLYHVVDIRSAGSAINVGGFPAGLQPRGIAYSADTIYALELAGTQRVYSADRFTRTAHTPDPMLSDPDAVRRTVDANDVPYFDESVYAPHPFEMMRAYAAALEVPFLEALSSPIDDEIAGQVQFGPAADIADLPTAYHGWTGQFVIARPDGALVAVWPADLRAPPVLLDYTAVEPLEARPMRQLVANTLRASGVERRT